MKKNPAVDTANPQALLNQIVFDYMREQTRKKRWRWVLRILILLAVGALAYALISENNEDRLLRTTPHVGLIDIKDGIFEAQEAGADNFSKSMARAFANANMRAMILRINSPGGSPVQADYIYNLIKQYQSKYPQTKIYAVCVDICASAAYYVAAAADDIYANPASLVGSIGVLYNGFGFVDTMQKLGVTRRLETAGSNKGFMDPFLPINPAQEQKMQVMLDLIHQRFIAKVKEGRGDRLKVNDDMFSGLFWTGTQAKDLGLIDGFASSGQLARDIIKLEKIVDYSEKTNVWEQMAKNIGMSAANQLPKALGLRPTIQ